MQFYVYVYVSHMKIIISVSRNRDINAFPLENEVYVNGFGLETYFESISGQLLPDP